MVVLAPCHPDKSTVWLLLFEPRCALKQDLFTPAITFQHLLGYMQRIGIAPEAVCEPCGLSAQRILATAAEAPLPMQQFSALYNEAAKAMQSLDLGMPWAAGIGTDAFRFLCHSIIHSDTLEIALLRAGDYTRLLYPLTHQRVQLVLNESSACLMYEVDAAAAAEVFVPQGWERTARFEAVAKASGVKIWHAFIGWLVGRNPPLERVEIGDAPLSSDHHKSLQQIFQCPVTFSAPRTALHFPRSYLQNRLIHSEASLAAFLENAIYTLAISESQPSSTSHAVKSLLARADSATLPGLEEMAALLHMSASSLRRRLHAEAHSYQQIKDEYRRDRAILLLSEGHLKIHEVGEQLGFLETSSFTRSFKKWTGKTPKAMQEQLLTIR